MRFQESKSMKIAVLPEQQKQLSTPERIQEAMQQGNVLAFDVFLDDTLIGFALLRAYAPGEYFLWDYAIDRRHQGRGYGTEALRELMEFLRGRHGLRVMTTTYVWGNERARRMYETVGFVETNVVDEPGCHEVDMRYEITL